MLAELRAKLKIGRRSEHKRLRALKHELDKIEIVLDRLYDAVESGRLPQDGSLQDRVRKHQTRRQDILLGLARCRGGQSFP